MATFNFLVTVALFFTIATATPPAPSPALSTASAPDQAETKDEIIWESCARKMTADCGHDVVTTFVGTNANDDISMECCSQLLNMGVECHNTMVKLLLTDDDFKEDKYTILAKSTDIWNQCVSELGTEDLSPTPAAPVP